MGLVAVVGTHRPEILPSPSNASIVEHGGALFIVDAGATPSAEPVVEAVERLGRRPEAVLLTHFHWDHTVGLVGLLEKWRGLAVYASRATAEMLWDREGLVERVRRITIVAGFGADAPIASFIESFYGPLWRLSRPEILGLDGLPAGVKYAVCPGHTPDHVCYLIEGTVFVGDNVVERGAPEVLDAEEYLCTVGRIAGMEWERLVPGHGRVMERGEALEKLGGLWARRAKRLRSLARVLSEAAVRGEDELPTTSVLEGVYGGPPATPFEAFDRAYNLLGLLAPLEKRGAASLVVEGGRANIVVSDPGRVEEAVREVFERCPPPPGMGANKASPESREQ